jgi:hypothetical protein
MLINRIFYCKHMIKTKHVTHHNIRSLTMPWNVRETMFVRSHIFLYFSAIIVFYYN